MTFLQLYKVISQRHNHGHYLQGQYQLRESQTFCTDAQFYIFFCPHVPAASFYILMWMSGSIIEAGKGSFHILRVPMLQNDCFRKVKLSMFMVYWVSVIAPSRPPREQSAQDLAMKCENFGDVLVIEKFIDRLETKMTDVDPSVVGQHVRPLENNYFKACWLAHDW